MSVLTKVFVVLLVVLSLLLSAAAVTFLNTVPTLRAQVDSTEAALRLAQAEAARSNSQAELARSNAERQVTNLQSRLSETQRDSEQAQTRLDEARADIARLQGQLSLEQATVAANAQAVNITVQQYQDLQQQLTSLRQETSQITGRYGETQAQLNQVQNELVFAERALRSEREKNRELLSRVQRAEEALARLGGDPTNPATGANVNGVIVSRTQLPNGPYASISVGREDDVVRGMELAVFDDRSGNFLGLMTVEEVDDKTAFGSLRGDRLGEISPADVVRTAN